MNFLRFLYTMNRNRVNLNYKHFIIPVYAYTVHVNYLEYKKLQNKID